MKTALQLAHEAHKGHPFFHCLNPLVDKRLDDNRRWFLDLREQMWKRFYVRAVEQGDKLDESAPPLGIEHAEGDCAVPRHVRVWGQMGQTRSRTSESSPSSRCGRSPGAAERLPGCLTRSSRG